MEWRWGDIEEKLKITAGQKNTWCDPIWTYVLTNDRGMYADNGV